MQQNGENSLLPYLGSGNIHPQFQRNTWVPLASSKTYDAAASGDSITTPHRDVGKHPHLAVDCS